MSGAHGHGGGAATTADASLAGTDSMGHMIMVFFTGTGTPLYSYGWTPSSVGAYAATCIFLVLLAVLFRALLAGRALKEARWLDQEMNRRYVVVQGRQTLGERVMRDSESRKAVLSENGIEEDVVVLKKRHTHVRPWRLSVDPLRAVMDTVIVGVGYLL